MSELLRVPRAYFDHAATTPLSAAALDAMRPHLLGALGGGGQANASSIHLEGQRARAAVEEARGRIARALRVEDDEIVFTSSGTESINLALRGTAWLSERGSVPHLVTSAIEHEAVLRTARMLERRGDLEVTFVAPRADGTVDAEAVMDAVRETTTLVSLMAVNNETGAVQPVASVGRRCRELGVRFHVDAVQALGKLPVEPHALPADLVSLSAHKVNGPQGCGVLFVRRGLKLQPATTGGAQESGLRAGTEAVATIAGAAAAIADAAAARERTTARLRELGAALEKGLTALEGATINAAEGERVPGLVSVSFEGADGTHLVQALDLHGFAASVGSACAAGSTAGSHVLAAMGLPPALVRGAVRFSLGESNTEEEISRLVGLLPSVLSRARAHAGQEAEPLAARGSSAVHRSEERRRFT